jgi:hypothetical protein
MVNFEFEFAGACVRGLAANRLTAIKIYSEQRGMKFAGHISRSNLLINNNVKKYLNPGDISVGLEQTREVAT